jgi:hypothetical protein
MKEGKRSCDPILQSTVEENTNFSEDNQPEGDPNEFEIEQPIETLCKAL